MMSTKQKQRIVAINKLNKKSSTQKRAVNRYMETEIALNRISDGVVSVDRNWHYTFLNDAALATHPGGKDETVGKVIWDVHPEMGGTIFWDKYHEAMETGKVTEVEDYYAPMDIWFSVKVYPSADGLTIFYKNITEKKRLEERQDLFVSIVNSCNDAIISKTLDGIINSWNTGAEKIFGYTSGEIIGKSIATLIPLNLREEEAQIMARIRAGKNIDHYETQRIRKDGSIIDVSLTISPIKDAAGNIAGASKILSDITERKLAEGKIRELNAELEERVDLRTEQLRKTNAELESFSYSVSHDLRAPLRIIDGFGQILMEDYFGKIDADGQEVIKVIINNARKMGQLIDDLLNFSKTGRSEMRIRKVNMNALVKEVIKDLKTSGVKIPAHLKVQQLRIANGDSQLLKQVWINLISNAIKYSGAKKDPVIEIGMLKENGEDVYCVKDNGAGFDMKYADKLFGVFQRLHDEAEFSGTGVGLALVQRIILRHNGKIWAHAGENKGAAFYFTVQQ